MVYILLVSPTPTFNSLSLTIVQKIDLQISTAKNSQKNNSTRAKSKYLDPGFFLIAEINRPFARTAELSWNVTAIPEREGKATIQGRKKRRKGGTK